MTNQMIFIWLLTSSSCFLTCHTQVLYDRISPESNCKLSKARQAISDAAECTACIPRSAVMSSIHKVWKSVIQGQQNKAANRESKYITAHFSPPELNWQCWISKSGPGPNGNNSTHSSLEWRERRTAASWEPGRHLADLRCLLYDPSGNWVGAGSLSSAWLCVCVCDYDWIFLGKTF